MLDQQLLVSQTFTPDASLRVFAMVVVGGLGSISGAVLGAVFVYGVQYFLPPEYAFLATGAGLLLVLMLMPGRARRAVRRRARRRAALVRAPQGHPRAEPRRRHARRARAPVEPTSRRAMADAALHGELESAMEIHE